MLLVIDFNMLPTEMCLHCSGTGEGGGGRWTRLILLFEAAAAFDASLQRGGARHMVSVSAVSTPSLQPQVM